MILDYENNNTELWKALVCTLLFEFRNNHVYGILLPSQGD